MLFFDTCIRAFVSGNLGDDLFIDTLCTRYPETNFILCGKYKFKKNFKNLSNLTYVSIDSLFMKWLFRAINIVPFLFGKIVVLFHKPNPYTRYTCFDFISRHSHHNILISGSIFMQDPSSHFVLDGYLKKELKYYQTSPYVIGCNFGPFHDIEYLEFFKKCFDTASCICFRDSYSHSLFKEKPNVKWAPDILFTYKPQNAILPSIKDYILISVINPNKDNASVSHNAYLLTLHKLIKYLLSQNEKIVLMGFCNEQGDMQIIDKLMEQFPNSDKLLSFNYPDIDYHQATGYIANAKYILATRYHAMILGMLFHKKVYPISYNEKMIHVIEDLCPSLPYINLESIEQLNVELLYQDILKSDLPLFDIAPIVKQAHQHFEEIDLILKQKNL